MREEMIGDSNAPIRLARETHEVYRWTTIDNLQSPVALNDMRRVLLQAAVRHSPEEREK